jgi:hypothetical protein
VFPICDIWTGLRIRIRILLFSSVGFRIPTKNNFFTQFCMFHLHLHFYISLQRLQVTKKAQNCRNQGFSCVLCLLVEGSGFEKKLGAGSGRPKNLRILRIRIRNTGMEVGPYHIFSSFYLNFFCYLGTPLGSLPSCLQHRCS